MYLCKNRCLLSKTLEHLQNWSQFYGESDGTKATGIEFFIRDKILYIQINIFSSCDAYRYVEKNIRG